MNISSNHNGNTNFPQNSNQQTKKNRSRQNNFNQKSNQPPFVRFNNFSSPANTMHRNTNPKYLQNGNKANTLSSMHQEHKRNQLRGKFIRHSNTNKNFEIRHQLETKDDDDEKYGNDHHKSNFSTKSRSTSNSNFFSSMSLFALFQSFVTIPLWP